MKKESRKTTGPADPGNSIQRINLKISGTVQGVGFRPFIYRLAKSLNLAGWINNSVSGVEIELEGSRGNLADFMTRLECEKPSNSYFQTMNVANIDPCGETDFRILMSNSGGKKTAVVLPDMAVCPDCLREIFDPNNRRYLYPFTNCTNCGPRYSIIKALPYDRINTTMAGFYMCDQCREEYENPSDRRFHAQPNACHRCGPHLELWDKHGKALEERNNALGLAVEAVLQGQILALKGLGGFHLIVDAQNHKAVKRLRLKKGREEKPFALMYPGLEMISEDCEVSELEKKLLTSCEAPIVLLHRRRFSLNEFPRSLDLVAPGNPWLGIMLPYTPLHHILMKKLAQPIVATSGNLSEEPICIDENEALERLGKIADVFLMHNRPIARHVDDSVVRVVLDREMIMRRARGYAPLPVNLGRSTGNILAVGAYQKNTVAVSSGENIFISQHIGDLDNQPARHAFDKTIDSLSKLYEHDPAVVACDKHPDYSSTIFAEKSGRKVVKIQHHYAHILAGMAEHNLEPPLLGVSWDGTGYGGDGTIWGGEFLRVDNNSYERSGMFRAFPLPGGEKAAGEPRRSALGLMYEIYGKNIFCVAEPNPLTYFEPMQGSNILHMLRNDINCPRTSSVGRLFDAVASLLDYRQIIDFEGQAAMQLEFAAEQGNSDECYEYYIEDKSGRYIIDWESIIQGILHDRRINTTRRKIAAKFHNTLAEIIVEMARKIGETKVVLSGGCFQNKYLTEYAVRKLSQAGFLAYWHRFLPPNDGGISAGQILGALRADGQEP